MLYYRYKNFEIKKKITGITGKISTEQNVYVVHSPVFKDLNKSSVLT